MNIPLTKDNGGGRAVHARAYDDQEVAGLVADRLKLQGYVVHVLDRLIRAEGYSALVHVVIAREDLRV